MRVLYIFSHMFEFLCVYLLMCMSLCREMCVCVCVSVCVYVCECVCPFLTHPIHSGSPLSYPPLNTPSKSVLSLSLSLSLFLIHTESQPTNDLCPRARSARG